MAKDRNNLIDKDFWSNKNTNVKYIDVKKDEKSSSIFKIIIKFMFVFIVIFWFSLIVTDYFRTKNNSDPLFCYFNKKVTQHDRGEVEECTGFGYKVIKYDFDENRSYEFGPFWISYSINN